MENVLDHKHKTDIAALDMSSGDCFELPDSVYFNMAYSDSTGTSMMTIML